MEITITYQFHITIDTADYDQEIFGENDPEKMDVEEVMTLLEETGNFDVEEHDHYYEIVSIV